MKYQVLMAASMKMAVFWDVAPCSLVETDRHFILVMDAVRTSGTLVNFYETTRRIIPEDSHIQTNIFFLKNSVDIQRFYLE
jgi:hypothetical protein